MFWFWWQTSCDGVDHRAEHGVGSANEIHRSGMRSGRASASRSSRSSGSTTPALIAASAARSQRSR